MADKDYTAVKKDDLPTSVKIVRELYDWIEIFALSAAVVLLIFTFAARLTVVKGPSMEDTLHENEFLIVTDAFYEPAPGDIVVCHNISTGYRDPIVKRVIATEGQVIDIDFTTWTVTVDGVVLDEPYRKLAADALITSDLAYPLEVPENCVFVMGDNRNHSADSRLRQIGPMDTRCIVGKAILRIAPLNKFGLLD